MMMLRFVAVSFAAMAVYLSGCASSGIPQKYAHIQSVSIEVEEPTVQPVFFTGGQFASAMAVGLLLGPAAAGTAAVNNAGPSEFGKFLAEQNISIRALAEEAVRAEIPNSGLHLVDADPDAYLRVRVSRYGFNQAGPMTLKKRPEVVLVATMETSSGETVKIASTSCNQFNSKTEPKSTDELYGDADLVRERLAHCASFAAQNLVAQFSPAN